MKISSLLSKNLSKEITRDLPANHSQGDVDEKSKPPPLFAKAGYRQKKPIKPYKHDQANSAP